MMKYRVTPTEPDGNVYHYVFPDRDSMVSFCQDILGPEYGYAPHNVDVFRGDVLGYGNAVTHGGVVYTVASVIGTVERIRDYPKLTPAIGNPR